VSIITFFIQFLGAVEKQKLVYIMNRDAAARLTISSPLEAHKAHTLVFGIVGIDVGFENPMFACLELDYEVSFNTIENRVISLCYGS
jgi:splicing factor 3B subunit 3